MPTASIIVTSYNIEPYIEECLESVAAQSLQDIEVLVVDDGSSDGTPDKIREFASRDSRFVPVLLGENSPGGVATAANAGLERATGRWVGFVDGDDFVERDMFERLVQAAESEGAELAMCKYAEVDDASGQRSEPADAHRWAALDRASYDLDPTTRQQFLRFIAVPWRKLYRRTLLEQNAIRFPVGDYFYEDNPFHWFALVSARSIAVVPTVLAYHRVARAGQTMSTADERLFRIFAHHDTIHDWLAARNVLEIYQTTLLTWVISQLEWISRRTPEPLRPALYDTVRPIFGHYPVGTVQRALTEGSKGEQTRRLTLAVAKDNRAGFLKVLSGRPATDNKVLVGWHHLRYSGVRETASMTRKYAQNRLEANPRLQTVARLGGSKARVDHADLFFGLAVLQQQVACLQEQVARLAEAQDAAAAPVNPAVAPEVAGPR
ncbi:glycosyltransferase family 2 protein [Flexivirga caeni]|uniref:Glycosyltransferase family 2 protein n=1 Tax=Flexivirga caeni TaxID=2294115 RepID=A0A3M9M7V1_9MICO|nr:glycosyltransferase family 2 protein [Flexivirga caeni]RNI21592.1 glycosyltransferase family 2 protein [Flexivirga caeni]